MIYGISFKFLNDSVLNLAASKGHSDIVELLLRQKDIDVNIKDI